MKWGPISLMLLQAFRRIPRDSYFYRCVQYLKSKLPGQRQIVAARHLKGVGIEIGAMHNPTVVPKGATVQYVDYVSREENLRKFPEIRHLNLVSPDFIEDGFSLPSFSEESRDFVIANHVLEHANNALGTMMRWAEILRPNGKLFLSVPLAERCFDKGRLITRLDHFINDYELCQSGDVANFRKNTLNHYFEWQSISLPAILAMQRGKPDPQSIEELKKRPEDMLDANNEIHFHTFSMDSFKEFLHYFCSALRPDFSVSEVVENGIEVIGVIHRRI